MYLSILIAGFGGGAVRGIMGFLKHQTSYKNVEFNLYYFILMTFLSGIIGLLISTAIYETGPEFLEVSHMSSAIAFIVGYAGGDFIDGVYKIIARK